MRTRPKVIRFALVVLALVQTALAAPASAPAPAARTLYLVRHGAYDSDTTQRTPDGPGLVSLGIAQSRLTAARLHALPQVPKVIVASSMRRARETAAVLHETLPDVQLGLSDALRECTPRAAGATRVSAEAALACEQQLDAAFANFFVPAAGAAETDVLVCHGNVIRYFVMKALGVDATHWLQMTVGNASVTVIRIEPNGVFQVLSVGDVGHLPPNLQSGTGDRDPQLTVP
ncbi:MAG TPA: histidine phosphatase family protein [Steroidobacteraceae bacterium]|jgi:serine/threonine-protein phosphatase PGAM5|nr:histidine phosphatase family protein [Steroidobacteraceae bacterium]